MTTVLIGKGLVLGGLTLKNRGHLGSRYIYITNTYHLHLWIEIYSRTGFPECNSYPHI